MAHIKRQLLLADSPVRPEPRPQQRPYAFDRIAVDFMHSIAVLVPGILAQGVVDGLVVVAPLLQPGVNVVLVRVQGGKLGDRPLDEWPDGLLPHIGQHRQPDRPAPLGQTQDGALLLTHRPAPALALQTPPTGLPARFDDVSRLPLVPGNDVTFVRFNVSAKDDIRFFFTMPSRMASHMRRAVSSDTSSSCVICSTEAFRFIR